MFTVYIFATLSGGNIGKETTHISTLHFIVFSINNTTQHGGVSYHPTHLKNKNNTTNIQNI